MGNRHFGVTASLCCCAWALLVSGITARGILREAVCGSDLLAIDCASRRYIIAIHGAYVTADYASSNISCTQSSAYEGTNFTEQRGIEENFCVDDVRIYVNKRCSGRKKCTYSYQSEVGRKCDTRESAVVVHYSCVKESTLHKYCNTRLNQREGYITSPGYPLFYPRLTQCRWDIDAADGYIVVIQLLHLHLRPPTVTHYDEEYPIRSGLHPDETKCDVDYLRIEENGVKSIDLCGESTETLQSIQAEASNGISLQFFSKEFFPGSGFLIYFKVRGCATLSPPEDVHFVVRNGNDALYRCDDDLVFNDTLENHRVLSCIGDHRWNNTLHIPCVELAEVVRFHTNHSSDKHQLLELENMTNDQEVLGPPVSQKRTSFVEDIVVPSILMTILVIGNAIIIFIIFAIRRRHEAKRREEAAQADNPNNQQEGGGGEERPLGQTTTV